MSAILPVLARLRLPHWPALWLPVFLLWPLLALAFALCLAAAVPAALVLRAPRRKVLLAVVETFHMLCALRGTRIRVSNADADFDISFY